MGTLCGQLPAEDVAAVTGAVQRAPHPARTSDLVLRVHADPTASYRRTVHRYWKRELADPGMRWLIPWCSGNTPYPERHERGEIDFTGFANAEWCRSCTGLGNR
ncbi:hypothetical protein [Amycolatopsis echigonensis]|uniref:Uncharacterized protein n=1 Tax=Amycolatopsis echigonensis TaxID=2576905 RepID=A0A8E1W689_9PSEU|nr:hypothetical protein [Amycolatopsis echigonensis]MBB2504334.1 hypothetical protein [Amycolatopsis echigonensis]